MKVVEKIAQLVCAIQNCKDNVALADWYGRLVRALAEVEVSNLPSGSGFDDGSSVVLEKSRSDLLVFTKITSFHHRDGNGYYTQWTEHTVTVRPDFVYGLDIKVSGRNVNGIKDYIAETFYEALWAEYKEG